MTTEKNKEKGKKEKGKKRGGASGPRKHVTACMTTLVGGQPIRIRN